MAALHGLSGTGQQPVYMQMPPSQQHQQQMPPGMAQQIYLPGQVPLPVGMVQLGGVPTVVSPIHAHHMSSPPQHLSPSQTPTGSDPVDSSILEDPVLAKFAFFRGLAEKKTTRDGQVPKRRGPKPDSKPALTRRQELNRQAQRTHRERKEMYIKALEQEVIKLKHYYVELCKERDRYQVELAQLYQILASHGIYVPKSTIPSSSQVPRLFDDSSTGSLVAGTESTRLTSPSQMHPSLTGLSTPTQLGRTAVIGPDGTLTTPSSTGLDYDHIGLDLVLTLERPCMDHMQFLMMRSNESEGEISGHALMATCPPGHDAEGHSHESCPQQYPEIGMKDLVKLLDLSSRLPLDGEITPIMAWSQIIADPRCSFLETSDFRLIRDDLLGKVRCYGFGAVLEEFEVRDALEKAFTLRAKAQNALAALKAAEGINVRS